MMEAVGRLQRRLLEQCQLMRRLKIVQKTLDGRAIWYSWSIVYLSYMVLIKIIDVFICET